MVSSVEEEEQRDGPAPSWKGGAHKEMRVAHLRRTRNSVARLFLAESAQKFAESAQKCAQARFVRKSCVKMRQIGRK